MPYIFNVVLKVFQQISLNWWFESSNIQKKEKVLIVTKKIVQIQIVLVLLRHKSKIHVCVAEDFCCVIVKFLKIQFCCSEETEENDYYSFFETLHVDKWLLCM